jgi:hypothetical protein
MTDALESDTPPYPTEAHRCTRCNHRQAWFQVAIPRATGYVRLCAACLTQQERANIDRDRELYQQMQDERLAMVEAGGGL